ncbi:pseudouridine synthase [Sphingomonas sp. MAH-20]|uniref:Pseudouridine synthase n=1 Tax=Sphingomonas horti TaxID=2682842 RepID=A0A6I4J4T0_9SPHN|nr:pseudouridine synthase [Sphingomonas horti]MBA2919320.1 rRNA pseudouridine synthase [Sphingomonas sp. CGMCC 1.13658]MVO78201.1 pseudouridine synthase [Sphingomonas horti]
MLGIECDQRLVLDDQDTLDLPGPLTEHHCRPAFPPPWNAPCSRPLPADEHNACRTVFVACQQKDFGSDEVPAPQAKSREAQRIAKLLARAGVASRREIERMIAERRIAIDGTVVETPATLVESLHGVTVDGRPVKPPAPARLFRYHKPAGLLTTERDPKGRPTIYDRLPKGLPRLMPVGRLDLNTEGLLLLTTDGELKRALELPRTGVPRTYRARAYGNVTQAQLEELIHGVEIDGVRYGSIDANLERRTGANVWIELTLAEGKNREVRRVLEHLGLRVSRLIRTSYGPFALADLPAGAVDEVRQHDLVVFRNTLKSAPPRAQLGEGDRDAKRRGGGAAPRPRAGGGQPSPPLRSGPLQRSPDGKGSPSPRRRRGKEPK